MKWLENADEQMYSPRPIYRVFSRDVTAAMLVYTTKAKKKWGILFHCSAILERHFAIVLYTNIAVSSLEFNL